VAPFLAAGDGLLWSQIEARLADAPPTVAWHAALAFGEVLQAVPAKKHHARAIASLAAVLAMRIDDATLRGIVAAQPRQLDVLQVLLPGLPDTETAASAAALRALARALVRGRQAPAQLALFDLAAARAQRWQGKALLRGALDALPKAPLHQGWLVFTATPPALAMLAAGDSAIAPLARELLAAVALRDDGAAAPEPQLTAEQQAQVAAGRRAFALACAACHQLDGKGMQGLAPPLFESEWVAGPPDRLLRIVLHGVKGPIEVGGTTWSLEMPGQGHLPDGDLAAVLSYVRRAFGNRGGPVSAQDVAAVRAAHKKRAEPWTAAELLGAPAGK